MALKSAAATARSSSATATPSPKSGENFARACFRDVARLPARPPTPVTNTFLEVADGSWVRANDAVVPTPSDHPAGHRTSARARGTWIEASVNGGWLIAYENMTPVFTTLISPGRGGAAIAGEDPVAEARNTCSATSRSQIRDLATMEAPGAI